MIDPIFYPRYRRAQELVSQVETKKYKRSNSSHFNESCRYLDTCNTQCVPKTTIRYGDTVRLWAKSEYAKECNSDVLHCNGMTDGGYVGWFDSGKLFRHSKHPDKQGDLACIPPLSSVGQMLYQESRFTVISPYGVSIGTPIHYGDIVVLVDEQNRVWNNKIGLGPTSFSGYVGPRPRYTAGEIFLYFSSPCSNRTFLSSTEDEYDKLKSGEYDRSHSDDNDSSIPDYPEFSRSVSENGQPSSSRSKIPVYYGDSEVSIHVADSHRMRTCFNQRITHYRRPHRDNKQEQIVLGGYLCSDGRGKPITFTIHGDPAPFIKAVLVRSVVTGSEERIRQRVQWGERFPLVCPIVLEKLNVLKNIEEEEVLKKGKEVQSENIKKEVSSRSDIDIVLSLSDGGCVEIHIAQILESHGDPFFVLTKNSHRPSRVKVQCSQRRKASSTSPCKNRKGFLKLKFEHLSGPWAFLFALFAFSIQWVFLSRALGRCYWCWLVVLLIIKLQVSLGFSILPRGSSQSESSKCKLKSEEDNDNNTRVWTLHIISWEASSTECVSEVGENKSADNALDGSNIDPKSIPKRFIIAENGDMNMAMNRWISTLRWREENNVNGILDEPQHHYKSIKSSYIQCLHKHDKEQHPVYIEKLGSIDLKKLKEMGIEMEDLYRHYIFNMEFITTYVANGLCPCVSCKDSDTSKLFIILDAKGIGMRQAMGGDVIEYIKGCTTFMQSHYPQRSIKICLLNVPSWFGMLWKLLKPMLSEATKAKTMILSESDVASTLLEYIVAENLPSEYGGTCSCKGGCLANSYFEQMERALVESVLDGKPFDSSEYLDDHPSEDTQHNEGGETSCIIRNPVSCDKTKGVLKEGYMLKRSVRHKYMNPIWYKRYFRLDGNILSYQKTLAGNPDKLMTLSQKTTISIPNRAQCIEVITPEMSIDGHSLLLYCDTKELQYQWYEAIKQVIENERLKDQNFPCPRSESAEEESRIKHANTSVSAIIHGVNLEEAHLMMPNLK